MIDRVLDNGSGFVDLTQYTDERGHLTYIEQSEDVPIGIERVYYIYDAPGDCVRGEHAHVELEQVMIAVAGSFEVLVDDGEDQTEVTLDQPDKGLYLSRMTWREMYGFSENAVCLVLASEPYDEEDYIHEYEEFQRAVGSSSSE